MRFMSILLKRTGIIKWPQKTGRKVKNKGLRKIYLKYTEKILYPFLLLRVLPCMSLIGPMYHPGMSLEEKVIEGRSAKIKSGLAELLHSG